jgi:hypothetical protein
MDVSIQELNQNPQSLLKDNRKCAYFAKLGIDRSFNQAKKYLSVGIAEQCDLFLDSSLLHFIADNHHSAGCFSLINLLLSFFRHHSRLLNFFLLSISVMSKFKYLPTISLISNSASQKFT